MRSPQLPLPPLSILASRRYALPHVGATVLFSFSLTLLLTVSAHSQVTEIQVSPSAVQLRAGEKKQVFATAYRRSNVALGVSFRWTTTDSGVVQVITDPRHPEVGTLVAVGPGAAVVAAVGGAERREVRGFTTVTVNGFQMPDLVTEVRLMPNSVQLRVGDVAQLYATAYRGVVHAQGLAFTWVSADSTIVRLRTQRESGVASIVGMREGETVVNALTSFNGGWIQGRATVKVSGLSSIVADSLANGLRRDLERIPGSPRVATAPTTPPKPPATGGRPSQGSRPAVADNVPARELIATGTGFFVDAAGHVVTNAHVVNGCAELRISGFGPESLTLIRLDTLNDLALLKSRGRRPPLALPSGRSVRPGDDIVVMGFPLRGLLAPEANVTTGTVSAMAGLDNDTRFVQITAPVQPGNSGGPLLDRYGRVVGVVSAKLDAVEVFKLTGDVPQNINFAISSGILRQFLDAAGVNYSSTAAIRQVSAAQVADQARSSIVVVECLQ